MKYIPLTKKLAAFVIAFLVFPMVILAQPATGGTLNNTGTDGGTLNSPGSSIGITIPNPVGSSATIWDLINKVITNIVLPLGAVLAVLYIMYAGFMMVTARGNEAQLKTARAAFFNAAIGTGVLLGSWVIAQVIKSTINSITTAP